MRLTSDQAMWAVYGLTETANDLKRQALKVRQRGNAHLPLRPAAEVVAAAYERAAIELDRARKAINDGGTNG